MRQLTRIVILLMVASCVAAVVVVLALEAGAEPTRTAVTVFGTAGGITALALLRWGRRAAEGRDELTALPTWGWLERVILELAGRRGRPTVVGWWLTCGAGWLLLTGASVWTVQTDADQAPPAVLALAVVGTLLLTLSTVLGGRVLRRITVTIS